MKQAPEYIRWFNEITPEDAQCLDILKTAISRLLRRNGIKAEVQGRLKSLDSIHCKAKRTGRKLETILDRIGLRIIVQTVPECYRVLGIFHSHFQPIPDCFKDYIGLPKENGYQSLHTCVYPVRSMPYKPIEFQIRTKCMHQEAEYGTASHRLYKWKKQSTAGEDQEKSLQDKESAEKTISHNKTAKFFQLLHQQIYQDNMVISGRAGRITRLPEKSSVKQYLKKVNTPISPKLIIKVNGRAAGIYHQLKDGDTIETFSPAPATEKNLRNLISAESVEMSSFFIMGRQRA